MLMPDQQATDLLRVVQLAQERPAWLETMASRQRFLIIVFRRWIDT